MCPSNPFLLSRITPDMAVMVARQSNEIANWLNLGSGSKARSTSRRCEAFGDTEPLYMNVTVNIITGLFLFSLSNVLSVEIVENHQNDTWLMGSRLRPQSLGSKAETTRQKPVEHFPEKECLGKKRRPGQPRLSLIAVLHCIFGNLTSFGGLYHDAKLGQRSKHNI